MHMNTMYGSVSVSIRVSVHGESERETRKKCKKYTKNTVNAVEVNTENKQSVC